MAIPGWVVFYYLWNVKQITYRILLNKEPEGGFTVTVPALPGCITYGATIDESITNAKEAVELYWESLAAHGEPIPTEENTFEYSLTLVA
jgi:antitoxin HicB